MFLLRVLFTLGVVWAVLVIAPLIIAICLWVGKKYTKKPLFFEEALNIGYKVIYPTEKKIGP